MICFNSHATSECPERTEQHCPDCHAHIRICSDHTSVCGIKTWTYKKYANLYVGRPTERFVISIEAPFRFLMNECWRKGTDGLEMYSPVTGAFFQYKSEYDLSFLSNGFVGLRIVVVVRDAAKFTQKLVLVTAKTQVLVAAKMNSVFDRNIANNRHTTLFLAVSAKDEPIINVNVFPKDKAARHYVLRYDLDAKEFKIPCGIEANGLNGSEEFGETNQRLDQAIELEMAAQAQAQCLELVKFQEKRQRISNIEPPKLKTNADCIVCLGVNHTVECQEGKLKSCHECHTIIRKIGDHAQNCSFKQWFSGEKVMKYVSIPSIRVVISFQSPINILLNGNVKAATPELKLFSPMSDSYFKFESNTKLMVMTTGYTRIRLPIIIEELPGIFIEKLVLLTSPDRTIVMAKCSRRIFEHNVVGDNEHNTPLVLYMTGNGSDFSIDVCSAGGAVNTFAVEYQHDEKKFKVPAALDVKSTQSPPMTFDAVLPIKRK